MIRAFDVKELLRERFSDSRQYAIATEVGNSTGSGQLRRIDMVVVNCYESSHFAIEGIEVKISTQDLKRELEHAEKHNVFFPSLDYFSLAAPVSVINAYKDVIPKTWGLYAVYESDDKGMYMRAMRKPLSLHDFQVDTVDKAFMASLIRRIACESPQKESLDRARREGIDEGMRSVLDSYQNRDMKRERERVEMADRVLCELSIWSDESADDALEAFKRFRKSGVESVVFRLSMADKEIRKTLDMLKGED